MLPNPNLPWPMPLSAVAFLAEQEGCRLKAYRNFPGEPWTCGWGETEGVTADTVWTQEYADQRFCDSLRPYVACVLEECTATPNDNELGAMVSLAYNIGRGWRGKTKPKGAKDGFRQSTVLRRHNAGAKKDAAQAFSLWDKRGDGKGGLVVEDGLHARRLREAALYLTPMPGTQPAPMPQAVEAESKMADSPINRGSAVIVATGVASGATQVADYVETIKGWGESVATLKAPFSGVREIMVDVLGIKPEWILPIVLVAGGVYLIRWRLTQREQGRA